ncbi:sugar-binding transcriptional regulator [Melissococcus plutonius]|uniref:sugar-binding transcriptional regulator n=1 Tax=Melissococcus plutonius TaxID=33970 RepID=UPI00065DE518|nr:sugar-binding transcriptional regulator [Melissococcus plutonius]KMT37810.1 deoxyribonucleoside regulator [Melissococcus plutonius]
MVKNSNDEKIKQSLMAAHLYYEENKGQSEIANQLGISRPTVSRLLQQAKQLGFVKIQIENPLLDAKELENLLNKKYHATIKVVPTNYRNKTAIFDSVGAYTADYLMKIVKPGDIIGIGWGKTIHAVTNQLEKQSVKDVRVVQLKGSVSIGECEETYAYESINELAYAFNTKVNYLPLPTIFDNQLTRELVEQDRFIKDVLELGRKANIALFTVGTVRKEALLFQQGYLNEDQKAELQLHAVGDVVSRFIDSKGQIVNNELNNRTIGIELEELKAKDSSIIIASGLGKVAGVHTVLSSGYANLGIFDSALAQYLVDYV